LYNFEVVSELHIHISGLPKELKRQLKFPGNQETSESEPRVLKSFNEIIGQSTEIAETIAFLIMGFESEMVLLVLNKRQF
jgi:hypothetical protein